MKKITLSALLFSLFLFELQAENNISSDKIKTPVAIENNFRNSLWYNTLNRSGLAFNTMKIWNDLDLDYQFSHGDFRSQTIGNQIHDVSVNTSGAAMLGKFMLLGNFSFINIAENGTCYNTVLYEVADDMPYFIIDPNKSQWIKQEYKIGASIVSPTVANIISFGLEANYTTKVGAKQKDPRSEAYKYNIEVIPSLTFNLGKTHLLGLYGLFDNSFERSVPTLNNYMQSQKITYNTGLGEGIIGKVGDNDGLKTVFYKSMRYGGGLQYAWGRTQTFLLNLGYEGKKIDGYESPQLPRRLGSTRNNTFIGDIQWLFGNNKSNKFTLSGFFSNTKGLEHIQKLNSEAFNQSWELLSSNHMSTYKKMDIRLDYDHLFGNDDIYGYNWMVGGLVDFCHKKDKYTLPSSSYSATNLIAELRGGKQFKFKTSTLLIELRAGYNQNLGGSYEYGGNKKESVQVEYYTKENAYLNQNFIKISGSISWTYTARKVNWMIGLNTDWAKPLNIKDDRLLCKASIGIIF